MDSKYKISVIVPCFNAASKIANCINSILRQEYTDVETIIVDGLSTDETINIVNRLIVDADHKIISEEDNGIYDAINKGIDMASGDYIIVLGADDEFYDNNVLNRVFLSDFKYADFIYGNVIFKSTNTKYDGKFNTIKLLTKNICHQAIFYHKSVYEKLGKYDTKYKVLGDLLFNIRCFESGDITIRYVDEIISIFDDTGYSNTHFDATYWEDFPDNLEKYCSEEILNHQMIIRENAALNQAVAERDAQIIKLNADLLDAEQRYAAIEGSTTWKVTYPLRSLTEDHPVLRRVCRGAIKLTWWTMTGRLIRRLRDRQMMAVTPPEIARAIEIDYSVAVPFGYRRHWSYPFPRLAVICHVYYEELASEFRRYLLNIPFAFDIFISTDDSFKKTVIEKAFTGWDRGSIEVRVTRNCGRDIAPKLIGFKDVYDDYEFILYLHSKKSDHDSVLENWRGFLLENLLGSPAIVLSVFDAFDQRPDLGIVASQHFEPVRQWINWGGNFALANQLANRIGFSLSEKKVLDFASGSMFWARTAAIKPLLDANLSFDEFTEENGQIDKTLSHAVERLCFYVCEHAGFEWIKISHPKLFERTPAIIPIDCESALDLFISNHGLRLTGTNLPKPRKVHPTPVASPAKLLVSRLQASALGCDLSIPPSTNVIVGVVTYNDDEDSIRHLVESAGTALTQAGLTSEGRVLIVDNGQPTDTINVANSTVNHLISQGNVGFGAAHNRLMAEAFGRGADMYIAANPDGAFHPDAITALTQMMKAHQGRALIEAIQFPAEHPKPYDPFTFETPWVSGACLAIPRCIFEELGGFDDSFFMYCEDVDLAWRARASGFPVRICPQALFLHAVTNRLQNPDVLRMIFNSGVILARKWGAPSFEAWLKIELQALGHSLTDVLPEPVPDSWRKYSDFSHQFSFAKARW